MLTHESGGDRSPVGTDAAAASAAEPRALPRRPNETGPARRRHKSSSLLTRNVSPLSHT